MNESIKFSLAVGVLGIVIGLYIGRRLDLRDPESQWFAIGLGALFFAISEFLVSVFFWFFIMAIIPFLLWIVFSRLWPLISSVVGEIGDGIDTFSTEAGISFRDARLGPQRIEVAQQLRDRLIRLDREIEEAKQVEVEGIDESDKNLVIAQLNEQRRFVQKTLQELIRGRNTPR